MVRALCYHVVIASVIVLVLGTSAHAQDAAPDRSDTPVPAQDAAPNPSDTPAPAPDVAPERTGTPAPATGAAPQRRPTPGRTPRNDADANRNTPVPR